jgi:hypothetical protein
MGRAGKKTAQKNDQNRLDVELKSGFVREERMKDAILFRCNETKDS